MRRKTTRPIAPKTLPLAQLIKTASAQGQTPAAPQRTAGRLRQRSGVWHLESAGHSIRLIADGADAAAKLTHGALVEVLGTLDAAHDADGKSPAFTVESLEIVHLPLTQEPALSAQRQRSLAEAVQLRAHANRRIRAFFDARDFVEVETPNWVEAAGTDVHLSPVNAFFQDPHRPAEEAIRGDLHTSPEFSMKRLLAGGLERIWQMSKVWRNGEITPLHNPEFTLLEWYRAWDDLDAIIQDVEDLSRALIGEVARIGEREISLEAPFLRMTMHEVIEAACGFDILEATDFDALLAVCAERELLSEHSLNRARETRRWDELFFELQIGYIDPFLDAQGPVFVTEWPTPLAVLARTKPEDPRVAQRFELYIGGVELANGFQELTDPREQRARFEADLATRQAAGLPLPAMPERFLESLEWGLPPSSGVAVGVDRYLMLKSGAQNIKEVAPFAMGRDLETGKAQWS